MTWRRLLFLALVGLGACTRAEHYDLLIRGGSLVDGTGARARRADVGIRADRIAAVGDLGGAAAERVIQAEGQVVAPGFIDMHSHSDDTLLADGRALSKVTQGVTTEVLGESDSAAPVPESIRAERQRGLEAMGIELDWSTFAGYFRRLERQGTSVNVLSLVGSGTLRAAVVGYEDRPATQGELDQMKALVAGAMDDGAIGLSSGLIYVPNRYATTDELIELSKVAAARGGLYTSHLRDEADGLVAAVDEAIRIGREAHLPVHILHFKFSSVRGETMHPASPLREAAEHIEKARAQGVDVFADVYPYVASQTTLNMRLPDWSQEGGSSALAARLRGPALRSRIKAEVEAHLAKGIPGATPDTVVLSRTPFEGHARYQGKTLGEIAEEMRVDPAEAILEIVEKAEGRASGIFFGIREDDLEYALKLPWTSIGSDGTALPLEGESHPHPRSFGTFPRVLGRYLREKRILTLEQAVHKMTGLPASQLGLTDRGTLAVGNKADIVVFDPQTISDRATFDEPRQFSVGIDWLLVNGTLVLDGGRHTGALPGKVIRGSELHRSPP